MQLTTYQKNIIQYFKQNSSQNMYINAKAGCGKTFIATKLLEDVTKNSIYVAFNKSIAEEMKKKINNPKVKVSTMHSLCYSIMLNNIEKEMGDNKGIGSVNRGNRDKIPGLNNFKMYEIMNTILFKVRNFEEKMFLRENYIQLYSLVRLKVVDLEEVEEAIGKIKEIIDEQGLFFHEEFPPTPPREAYKIVRKMDEMARLDFEKNYSYDFTDMLYITYLKLKDREWEIPYWAYYSNIVVDEAQDLSTIQLLLLKYFRKTDGRYVFILDPKQAIYAFSGANSSSFRLIKALYSPIEEFELPVNYRCPISHLELVNKKYDIGIQPRDDAPIGEIHKISKAACIKKAEGGDYIIGRKNKWLFPIMLELIKAGKPIYIKDEGLVTCILSVIDKEKGKNLLEFERALKNKSKKLEVKISELEKSKKDNSEEEYTSISALKDNFALYELVLILTKSFRVHNTTYSLTEFRRYVQKLLNTVPSPECITITSIHCVKGLEANNTFVLNEGEPTADKGMGREQRQQEYNLSYVALTRAKEKMYLVSPDGPEYN